MKTGKELSDIYDMQAKVFADFAPGSFTWRNIERPAFDYYLEGLLDASIEVLDAGCGSGRVIEHLVQRGVPPGNITGVDISEELLSIARGKIPDANFEKASVASSYLSSRKFDLITALMLMEFLDNENLVKAFRGFYEHLRGGGTLFFISTHPFKEFIKDPTQYPRRFWAETSAPWGMPIPIFRRPITDYINSAVQTGFRIESASELSVSGLDRVAQQDRQERERYAKYGVVRFAMKVHK